MNDVNSRVRLLDDPTGPATRVERAALRVLKETGEAPLVTVVERVADELYREELRDGAWLVDLGLFGSRLFVPDVLRSLKAYDGRLWQITNN